MSFLNQTTNIKGATVGNENRFCCSLMHNASQCTIVLLSFMVQPAIAYLAMLHIQILMISTTASQPTQMLQDQLQELLVPLHCILAVPDLPQSA